ncbi:thioredoxin TrxC [Frigidibacter sp. ROC022]|uniref:thioredoxin TrxC n=1 Tax=Frigidibacter sp. ROC022 TaxID=2971796 RepID=UPI00215B3577|nr:thioredoxin TrxC [Frigidibacter sp. ROC022]MCR8726744.1 thioredoxin TrxC [Frigidibacter sp. ROC022]
MADRLTLACLQCGQKNRTAADRVEAAKCATCGAKLVTGKVAEIDSRTLAAARGDGLPLLVDFWAPWCGPCRQMAPEFAKAAEALKGRVRFAKIDTERFPQVSAQFGIRGIPLLILFQNGKELDRLPGARPASGIVDFLRGKIKLAA